MKITRDVVTDIWPIYESGEASADTRALVDEFLARDAEFALALRDSGRTKLPLAPALPPDHERQALTTTQRLLRRGQWLLGFALFFTLLPMSGISTSGGLNWVLWQKLPQVAIGSLVLAAALWSAYAWHRSRLRVRGF